MADLGKYAVGKVASCLESNKIPERYFRENGLDFGLRDRRGIGILSGLTTVSKISAFDIRDGEVVPKDGKLWYRGIPIKDLVGSITKKGQGFGRTAYLLLFGKMPSEDEIDEFNTILTERMFLSDDFVRDCIIKQPTRDIMNSMTRGCLALGAHEDPDVASDLEENIVRSIELISVLPMMAVYSMHSYNYAYGRGSMYIHKPQSDLSVTENILRMLRPDARFTELEVQTLDAVLQLHMEHGAGTNSTFTAIVVTSAGSDIYSTVAAAMASLKGAHHGGANVKCHRMMRSMRESITDENDREGIYTYLDKVLAGEEFDGRGLIYGMGHALYTISDPRAELVKKYACELARAKGYEKEFRFYETTAEIAPGLIMERKHPRKPICPNIDFYSGLIYEMLGLPEEMYTPMFAMARIVGWCAHRLEQLSGKNRIIRPLYKNVMSAMNGV